MAGCLSYSWWDDRTPCFNKQEPWNPGWKLNLIQSLQLSSPVWCHYLRLMLSVFIRVLGKLAHFDLHRVLHVKRKGPLFAAGVFSSHSVLLFLFWNRINFFQTELFVVLLPSEYLIFFPHMLAFENKFIFVTFTCVFLPTAALSRWEQKTYAR